MTSDPQGRPPTRIAMVSEHASPLAVLGGVDAGGQNVHVADLARAIGRFDVEVVVHTRRDDPSLPARVPFAPNVWVDHVAAGPAAPVPKDELLPHMDEMAVQLHEQWAADPPEVVHSHFWMSGLAALEAARPLGIPVMHTFHALGTVKRRHQGAADTSPPERIAVEERLAAEVDHVVATAQAEVDELVAMGADPGRITVVPCGVDTFRFCPDRKRGATGSDRFRVVVVSRLIERKGIGNVIEAVAQLPDAELVIAGGPPAALLDDDPEARRYAALVDELGIGDRVSFEGAVPRKAVPDLIRSADAVACCPWYEPFGLVAIEAMACGVPVVASAVGGLAESIDDGVTGLLVPPRRPDAIADALRCLAHDERRRRSMGAAAARRAKRYGWDRIAEETLNVADRVVLEARRAVRRSA